MVAFAICALAGLSTALGGLIVALQRHPSERFLAAALGFSAGVMLYISLVELLPAGVDGLEEAGVSGSELWGPVAFFAGVLLIAVIDRFVPEEINPHEEPRAAGGARMRKVGVMTALAIAIHNFPEGIAVAVPLREATGKKWAAAGWAALSGLAEPAGAVIGYLFLRPFLGPASLGTPSP